MGLTAQVPRALLPAAAHPPARRAARALADCVGAAGAFARPLHARHACSQWKWRCGCAAADALSPMR